MTHLLFCDETTVTRSVGGDFFLYCGLVVSPEHFQPVCDAVSEARRQLGLLPSEPLKFTPRARPDRVTPQDWTSGKDLLLRRLAELQLPLIGVYVHASIARSETKTHWAVDALCVKFNGMLLAKSASGFIIVDHTREVDRADLAEIASGAVAVSVFISDLSAIGGIGFGHVETALPLQAVDVVLGAFRYCLEHPEYDVSLALRRALDGLDGSLEQRPWKVMVPNYKADYDRLRADWMELGQRAAST